ncbi:MAG: hypothetical protein QNJ54_03975 [Prochloraceae cyanobacterium]|nr:hypothetical protein [Prochloraceae cyanobacterium]
MYLFYQVDRDIAAAQELCNRGIEKLSTQGLWGKEIGCQVGLSGAFSLDKWRTLDGYLPSNRAAIPNCKVGKPQL